MARGHSAYNRFVTRELREAKPRTRSEARAALKRAAAEWRETRDGAVPTHDNPIGKGLINLAIYAGLGLLAYNYIKNKL